MFYFQSFIQISNTVLCSSSQPDELGNESHPTTSSQFCSPSELVKDPLPSYRVFINSFQQICAAKRSSLNSASRMLFLAWKYTIHTVLTYECSHQLHIQYINRGGLKLSGIIVWFFLGLSFQKSIYHFHVPAHILKQAVLHTSEINSEDDVSTNVPQPLDNSFSTC